MDSNICRDIHRHSIICTFYHFRDFALVIEANMKNTTNPDLIKSVEVQMLRPKGFKSNPNLLEVIHVKPDPDIIKTEFTVTYLCK